VIDAKPIAAMAVPGELPPFGKPVAPDILEAGRQDFVQKRRRAVSRTRFVEEGPAGIEIADRQSVPPGMWPGCFDQSFPVRNFRFQVGHIDAEHPHTGDSDGQHAPRLRHMLGHMVNRAGLAACGDQHTIANAWRFHRT
jgi:hypothetical protein